MTYLDTPSASPGDARVELAAALLADPTRAAMLWALSDGRSLPASDLARIARVRPSTASAHLGRLHSGGFLVLERRGRHRFYRLSDPAVARALEALALIAPARQATSQREAHIAGRIRQARTCYDHLAGRLAVLLVDVLVSDGSLELVGREYLVTDTGVTRFAGLDLDVRALARQARRARRVFSRACLDWSERRYHLAGVLGAAFLDQLFKLEWIERLPATRAVRITNLGRRALRARFGVLLE